MMSSMDVFIEYMLKRKKDGKDIAIISVIVAAGVIITIAMIALMFALALTGVSMAFSIGFVLVALMWYGAYLLISMRNIEYEYILTNHYFDVDKIMAKRGRKRLLSIDFNEAEIVANIEDNEHNHAYRNNSGDLKVLDFTGDKERGHIYFADVVADGERKRILFQPTSKMIDAIKKFNPRNVFIYE